ncbi:MAG: tetraacyldisaccharide 4'-kinase [Phycisphaerales bacterium]|nr:tetraacyldisaccharide 4'-kinase [Phycisphaerales bacterium]
MSSPIKSPTRIPNAITRVMSWVYGFGIGFVNRRYDRGVGVTKLDVPVISIGNLSAGGTGKTPMVHWVAKQLIDSGKKPAIAMRGYGAKPGEMGDEEREHREALEGVPVVAQPDRIAGLKALFDSGEQIDCVILDDGFQHRKIARDVDIVLIDASRPPEFDALLPRGFLRETIESLARADVVIITRVDLIDADALVRLKEQVHLHAPSVLICTAAFVWESMRSFCKINHGWEEGHKPLDSCDSKSVRVVCGIGNADAFVRMIRDHGMETTKIIELADHESISSKQIDLFTNPANFERLSPVLMTRKDWVKVRERSAWPMLTRVWVPMLGIEFVSGATEIQSLITDAGIGFLYRP